ncbi:hypothetical protein [Methylobacterium brachiatum]|jgi:hypothetical protein|uniref:hypothetical protein n=1 Tax=Methylobacterium brachiatum TaxID=269660 RepID=UPI001E42E815|nr:hypothetical protein [Methylobacterium brachiatum]
MTRNPTVLAPRNASDVTGGGVTAVVNAVLTELAKEAYLLANGLPLDRAAAMASHKALQDAPLTDRDQRQRDMVRAPRSCCHTR